MRLGVSVSAGGDTGGATELGADGGCGSAFVSRHHRPERGDAGALLADREVRAPGYLGISVLIQGEAGTGKDLIASTVQGLSARKDRPYEVVNCATLTRKLLPSELFGHERGAFTGAVASKQALLPRFLEGGELRPVGSTRTIRTDVRVIAATNRDLEEAVGRREFREDLYHRLSDVVLEVPPLRARQDDIPLLTEHFLGLFNRKYDLAVTGVAAQAMAAMTGYGWAGNVRALAKLLREAMLLREQGWVELDDLTIATSAGRGPFTKAGEAQAQPAPVTRAPSPVHTRREAALRMAWQQGGVTRRQLAVYCGISGETARGVLSMLARLGLLRLVGKGSVGREVRADVTQRLMGADGPWGREGSPHE